MSDTKDCPRCKGFLMINKCYVIPGSPGGVIFLVECPVCNGTGKIECASTPVRNKNENL